MSKEDIKTYFNNILKQVDDAINKNDYELAEDLLTLEFENPLIDFETGKKFTAKLQALKIEKETFFLENEMSSNYKKSDFYSKIFDPKHKYINEFFFELFITKYINDLDDIDFAFINSIFNNKELEITRKIDAFIVLVKNNINIELDFYNKYLDNLRKINPVNYLDTNLEVQLTKNIKYHNVYDHVMKYYEKEPSTLPFAQTFLYSYLFYHFPFEMNINETILKETIIKLIDGFNKNISNLELNYEEQEVADLIMTILPKVVE